MSEQKEIKGYKVFHSDWTCKDFQYKVGESYEMDETPIACERGFHFCKRLIDCYDYYKFSSKTKVAEITAYGEIDTKENKQCTNKIRIEREISWKEVLDIVNIGKDCTGIGNIGDENSGDYNTGDGNSSSYNSGYSNTGRRNSGTGNIGDWNSGNSNKGHYNSGNFNTGNWNSGDLNSSDFNSGCFNTKSTKIYMFNKLSDWTMRNWLDSEAKDILFKHVLVDPAEWIDKNNMTTSYKTAHPECETTGGHLRKLSRKRIFQEQQENWNNLDSEEKEIVMSIPNFDKEIFKKITGIDVNEGDEINDIPLF